MKDLEILLENKPGTLADMGEILGRNQVSLEGGGVFANGENSIAHFLVEDATKAREVLESQGIKVQKINDVIIQKLRQDIPGQLGKFCRRLADANINILIQYSDHSNQLVVVVDNYDMAKQISAEWMKEWW
uniref:Amino acid-binding ACT domain-containing protein n=1 Tax=Roseihalotalea indica TaxID=2867963 RepID=A0AA49JCP6_9BACT|nr:amino acid-binding ACT domain-containing protein [Tunicatimonas sp. TK19036]